MFRNRNKNCQPTPLPNFLYLYGKKKLRDLQITKTYYKV